MATLYWGGGTGTWDGFTTTNWYTDFARTTLSTRAPSAEDDVIFDSASNATAYTVTVSTAAVCRDVTISGPASGNLTLAGGTPWYIYGSLTLPATGFTRTYTGGIQFYGISSHTITTNGATLANGINFLGAGTYTLQDALNNSASLIGISSGTFDTNGKNLTCGNITAAGGATAGILTLGASTVNATSIGANAPLIINGGTSNITLSAVNASIGAGTNYTGNTFYNVTFSSNAITTGNFYGNNTFNNLTFTTRGTATVSNIVLFGNQTINGTLTIAGQSSVNRYFVRSNIVGTTRTLTVATVGTLTDVDFRDITVAGASSPWSGTRLGDCGGNTNITFPSAKTVYWNGTTGGTWTGNFWATGSGGSVSAANFPLAQDTAIIDDTGLNTGSSITGGGGYNLGTLTSTKTNAYTLSISPIVYGDVTLTTSTTATSFAPTFAGRVTQNLTSAGNTIGTITFNGYNASVKLADNTTVSNTVITSGGLDTDSKNFTISSTNQISTDNAGAFSLTLGSSAVSIAGTVGLASGSATAPTMTVSAGTSTITLTNGIASIGFANQTITWYNVTRSAASSAGSILGNNTFNNLTFTSPTATGVANLSIGGNQTINGTLALGGGTSATQRFAVVSNAPGTQRTITAATVTGLSDIDFRDIGGAGAGTWTGGTRIGDCGGNSGIGFDAPKTVYWNLAGTQNWSATGWATTSTGTPATNNFPLAQDTATFTDSGSAGTVTINAAWNIGTLDMSGRTSAMTIGANGGNFSVYGNVTYGSGVTDAMGEIATYRGTGTQTLTTAGKTVFAITVDKPSGEFRHGDAFTGGSIAITRGTYTTQNYNITANSLSSSSIITRSVTLGTSTLTLSGTSPVNFATSTGLTLNASSSTINLSSTSAKNFQGGGMTFGTVSSTGGTTNPLTITGSNTFGTLTNSARTFLIFASGTTQTVTDFTYSGASGSVVRWYTSIPGQKSTLVGGTGLVGTNSVNGGNNTGLSFTGTSPDYFYIKDISGPFKSASGNFFMFFTAI